MTINRFPLLPGAAHPAMCHILGIPEDQHVAEVDIHIGNTVSDDVRATATVTFVLTADQFLRIAKLANSHAVEGGSAEPETNIYRDPVPLGKTPIFYSYIGLDKLLGSVLYRCDTCAAVVPERHDTALTEASRNLHTEWHQR